MTLRWALMAVLSSPMAEGAEWRIEVFGGAASSLGSHLTVRQEALPAVEVDADWAGRSLHFPIYYAVRLSRWSERSGFSLQLIHHKLYLQNPPSEIQAFSISHGYNLLTLEWGRRVDGFQLSTGAGLVITHPETTVRGQTFRDDRGGCFATGPTLAVAFGRWLRLGRGFRVGAEGRLTASWARVPVAGGQASVPDRSVHLLLGVGYRF